MKTFNRFLFHHSHDTTKSVDSPQVRGLVKDVRKTWPNGVVYYKISDALSKCNVVTIILCDIDAIYICSKVKPGGERLGV